MLHNIPAELQELQQWVVSGDDKEPYDPRTHRRASVVDPSTWGTYEDAIRSGAKHIGFVLTAADPFTIIDLDDKPSKPISDETRALHHRILHGIESYTELSTSGRGYHIIVRGRIPSGVHRDSVEIYSSGRYMICTGNVVRPAPINDYQFVLDQMYGQMKPPEVALLDDFVSDVPDMDIVLQASEASNGAKFDALCAGQMSEYPSQSEADFALLSIIAFYTKDNEQVRRIFRMTVLGQREKAVKNDTYLNYALGKIRANSPPPVDLSAIAQRAAEVATAHVAPAAPPILPQTLIQTAPPDVDLRTASFEPTPGGLTFPPGVVGAIADYVYRSAYMPIPEVALAAALTLAGAICGRQYNFGRQGLGQYVVLLAATGTGKEGAASGIDRLIGALRRTIPMVDEIRGPAAFASGPAVIRAISAQPSMLSIQGEFGFTINRLNNAKPGSPESTLKQALMDIYTKSGWSSTIQSTVYSDREKNTSAVSAPNLNILGESTQVKFFEALDISASEDGLIPRLLLVEFAGKRPYPNWGHGFAPETGLIDVLSGFVATSFAMRANNQCFEIRMDAETEKMYKDYTHACLDYINASSNSPTAMLRTRSAAMVTRLASLIAVGVNWQNPIVTRTEFEWAKGIVDRSVKVLESRFNTGDIGDGDAKQLADVRSIIEAYYTKGWPQVKDFISEAEYTKGVLAYRFLVQRTANRSSFKSDRLGATNALKRTIQVLVETEELVELASGPGRRPGMPGAKNYGLGPHWKVSKK